MFCYSTKSVKREAGNHAIFCGISKYGIVLRHFRVASVEYSSMSSMANQLHLIFLYIFYGQ